MDSDSYKTIKKISQGIFKDKGSKFIAYAYPVSDKDTVKTIIENLKKEFHDARHHCFAYMIGHERTVWRVNDDGEPSGTAGKPILGQINSHGLTNILIVVVRYFGGTLLGVPGLINAYRTAADDAIGNSEIIECTVKDYFNITFPYGVLNDVMRILKEENIDQSEQIFDLECNINISVRLKYSTKVIGRLTRIEGLRQRFVERK
jgi:uncharacterized YigZ family protein